MKPKLLRKKFDGICQQFLSFKILLSKQCIPPHFSWEDVIGKTHSNKNIKCARSRFNFLLERNKTDFKNCLLSKAHVNTRRNLIEHEIQSSFSYF
jgi:hypothetical protein